MSDDDSGGDEGGGDQGGQGTPPTLRPSAISQRNPMTVDQLAPPREEDHKDSYEPQDEFTRPYFEELENQYKLIWDGELWLLFDEHWLFVGYFHTHEDAENEAMRRKPLSHFGM